jgi:diamine N-acetyltransferase
MLKGESIHLRALELSDVALLHRWENNPELWIYGDTLSPYSLEQLNDYVKGLKDIYADKQLRLAIAENTGLRTIGFADFFDFDPRHRRAAIGILIGEETDRNKGYGSESLQLMCNYAFAILGMHQLYCSIAADNPASIKLFESCGFVQYGLRREWQQRSNGWQDEVLFQKISSLE